MQHPDLMLTWQRQGARAPCSMPRLAPGEWTVSEARGVEATPGDATLRLRLPRRLIRTPARTLNALLRKPLPTRGPAHIAAELLAAARQAEDAIDTPLLQAIAALIDQALSAEGEAFGPAAPEAQRSRLQAYLLARLSERALSMDRVAEAFGMSRRSLYKLFETWGTTPRAFLHNAKLDRACALLSDASAPVSQIAEACGFSDPAHFSRAFQARHGQPPSAWRARQM